MTAIAAIDQKVHPADILLNLVVTILAPMFLSASNGDIGVARMAAMETIVASMPALDTINLYQARRRVDVIAVAHIIACGLAALSSLSLSMADNIPLPMALRLRGNAAALIRAAEQARRALSEARPDPTPLQQPVAEATVQMRSAPQTAIQSPAPKRCETPAKQPMPPSAGPQPGNNAILARVPLTEPKPVTVRAAALTTCAQDLLVNDRPRTPSALIRSSSA